MRRFLIHCLKIDFKFQIVNFKLGSLYHKIAVLSKWSYNIIVIEYVEKFI